MEVMIRRTYPSVNACARLTVIGCRVRLWRMDPSERDEDYPFKCETVIHTGHKGNIFNAHMLPHSTRMCVFSPWKLWCYPSL